MEDFLMKEIDKISEMLSIIASKLGLGSYVVPSEELAEQLNRELVGRLDIDIYELLEMFNPIEYLVSQQEFSDSSIESLAIMLHQAMPESNALNMFIKSATEYLDNRGFFSFALHSIL